MDICFGLGYNTLATLYYIKTNNLNIKINLFSPEFDGKLLSSLKNFNYPAEFDEFIHIIEKISKDHTYCNEYFNINVFNGDARLYLKQLLQQNIKFDIVYQDAFSSDVNHSLWTVEYFNDIYNLLSQNAILTTYSIATPIRLSIYENGFHIYEYKPLNSNRITIALMQKENRENFKYIDMELKKQRNTTAKPLYD